jgi:bacterial/archaeal transporter family protein
MSTSAWLPLALVAAFLYGLHNAFSRAASKSLSDELGVIVIQVTAALGVFLFVFAGARPVRIEGRSLGWAMAAGLAVGFASVLYFALLRKGAGLSMMGPVVLAGTTVVTTLAGFIFFGEKVTVFRIAGLVLATGGIFLLSKK